jgi:hypothetical protein
LLKCRLHLLILLLLLCQQGMKLLIVGVEPGCASVHVAILGDGG